MSREKVLKEHEGSEVHCVICGSEFKVFKTFGLRKRKNAQCLNCASLERHRLIWKFLKDYTNFFTEEKLRVLHFAPEKFFYFQFSEQSNVDYVPCDLFPELFQYDGAKIPVEKVDINNIPFDSNSFDVVFCNHVLEHIPDDNKAMTELYRVMKNDGWGIFQVPLDYKRSHTYEDFTITTPEAREKAFGQKDHVRIYGTDYSDRIKRVGFNVQTNSFALQMSEEERFRYGLKKQKIFYCEK